MFQGAITAIITPFANGQVDEATLREQVEFQIKNGIDGLVPVGTTGESPTLSHVEHNQVVDIVVDQTAGRVPVIAGTGSNNTYEALTMTKHAKEVGATASLQVNPYYNKPTQEGLYRHFMTIADKVDLPVVLYNIPGRCAVAMTAETITRLAAHPNIVAVKEATGSLDLASDIASQSEITILSGDDALTIPLMSIGGKGVISVTSNLIPGTIHELTRLALTGKWDEARALHLKLYPLFKSLFVETNPIPLKAAMQLAGRDSGELRLPMTPLTETLIPALESSLRKHGIIG